MHFDEFALIQTLDALVPRLRVAFAASCAERHLPLYDDFQRLSGRGRSETLTAAVKQLWHDLQEDAQAITALNEHLARVMEAIPSEENESEWPQQQACAEDVATAVAYALRCRISGESQEAAWAARRCYELADRVAINALADGDVKFPDESATLSHPRVQRELRLQGEALAQLHGAGSRDSGILEVLQRVGEWSSQNRYASNDC